MKPKTINLSKRHPTKFLILLLTKRPKFCPTTKGNVLDIKSDTKEVTRKLKMRERFWGNEYGDERLAKSKSNINVNSPIPELSNKLEQVEPTIDAVNDNFTKKVRRALKELQDDQDLVKRKADKGNT